MTSVELIAIVLSSSVLASVVTVVLGGFVNRVLKKLDYMDEYYKTVLNRRVEAYEVVEAQITLLKTSILAEDRKPYHMIFAYGQESFVKVMAGMSEGMSRSLWVSKGVQDALMSINHELLDVSSRMTDNPHLITLGQERYEHIANLRAQLEKAFIADINSLHEVKRFLSAKRETDHAFIPLAVETRGDAQYIAPVDATTRCG